MVLYRFGKEQERDNALAMKMTIVDMYDHLYAEWSLLKHYCEKHLSICRKMKRNRTKHVVAAYEESNIRFRNQLSVVRKER